MEHETEESGPQQSGIQDTRNRENSRWCAYCQKWLRLTMFSWIPSLDDALKYHQRAYCSKSPSYDGSGNA